MHMSRLLAFLALFGMSSFTALAHAEESPGFESIDPVAYGEMFVDAVHEHQAGHLADSFRKFLRLACGGDKASQEQVGLMYLSGEGVYKNSAMAYLWLKVASEFNFGPYRAIVKKFEKLLTPEQAKHFGQLAEELRAQYGMHATNMTCNAESSATFSSNIKNAVVCSPARSGPLLLVQRCYADEVRIGAAAR
jgi:hypothetical protein